VGDDCNTAETRTGSGTGTGTGPGPGAWDENADRDADLDADAGGVDPGFTHHADSYLTVVGIEDPDWMRTLLIVASSREFLVLFLWVDLSRWT